MSVFHASRTRSMGQIWFVVVAFLVAFLFVGWKTVKAIEEIDSNTTAIITQMDDLMVIHR